MLPIRARGDPRPPVYHHKRLRVHPKPGRDPKSRGSLLRHPPTGAQNAPRLPHRRGKISSPSRLLGEGFEQPTNLVGHHISDKTSPRDGSPSPRAGTPARRGPSRYGGHMSTGHLRSPTRESFTPEPLALLWHCLALNPHNPDGIRPENRFSRFRGHGPTSKCNTSPKHGEVSRSHILRGPNSGCT